MILEKIILRDFLTYARLEHDFVPRALQIQGMNLTDDGQKSIGSGKSGLQTAIEYAITATNSRGVKDDEIVRFGCDTAYIELYSYCKIRKQRLHIYWKINKKGSNKLSLRTQNDNEEFEDVSFSNLNDGKKYISNWFAISKDDLFNYYIINKNRFKSFFTSSSRENAELINRFRDASIIEGIEDVNLEKEELRLTELNTLRDSTNGKIELLNSSLEKEINRDFDEELNEEILRISEKIEEVEEEIEDLENEIELNKSHVEDIETRVNDIKSENLEMDDEIKETLHKIDLVKESLTPIKKELEAANKNLEDFISTDWESERHEYKKKELSLNSEKKKENENISSLEKQEEQLRGIISGLNVKLKGSIQCPKCSYEFILDGNIDEVKEKLSKAKKIEPLIKSKVEEANKKIDLIKESINKVEENLKILNEKEELENKDKMKLSSSIMEIRKSIGKYEDEIKELKEEIDSINLDKEYNKRDIDSLNNEISQCKNNDLVSARNIKVMKIEIEALEKSKSSVSKDDNSEIIEDLRSKIDILSKEVEDTCSEIVTLQDKIFEKNVWKGNFKKFKLYVANQSLEIIEYHCNRFLKGMKTDLRVVLEGYKTLSTGAVKDDISAKILRNGVVRSFGSYSGGERAKITMAGILANRYMINSTHPYGGLDFLSIDEITEGLDDIGIYDLMEVLKELNIPIYIITHILSDVIDDDIMLIVKENGISKIKE